jgi:hypothetical protein
MLFNNREGVWKAASLDLHLARWRSAARTGCVSGTIAASEPDIRLIAVSPEIRHRQLHPDRWWPDSGSERHFPTPYPPALAAFPKGKRGKRGYAGR